MMDLPSTDSYLELTLLLAFGLILCNLLLGLVVDSIAERRSKKEKVQDHLQQRCFICDLQRRDFEEHKIDFYEHINHDHNPMSFLFYLMWVTDQKEENGQLGLNTRNVKNNLAKGFIDFMPLRKCLRIQQQSIKEEMVEQEKKLREEA
jgi:hypothetical protein